MLVRLCGEARVEDVRSLQGHQVTVRPFDLLYGSLHAVSTYAASPRCRFAGVVYPGETLITEMWKEGDKVVFGEFP